MSIFRVWDEPKTEKAIHSPQRHVVASSKILGIINLLQKQTCHPFLYLRICLQIKNETGHKFLCFCEDGALAAMTR